MALLSNRKYHTTNFNVRIDEKLRAEATRILASYGLSPTQAIKLFFNQVVATQKVPLSFDYQAQEKQPTAKLLSAIAKLEICPALLIYVQIELGKILDNKLRKITEYISKVLKHNISNK